MKADIYPGIAKLINPLVMRSGDMVPLGVTVHYLADVNIERAIKSLTSEKLGYHFIIDRNGSVLQTCYLSHSVNHAGKADWRGHSPNRHHVAVALSSWGLASRKGETFTAWNGAELPAAEIARRPSNTSNALYHWHAATQAQEASLIKLLRWLVKNGIDPKNVCGHDECCIPVGRKSDPGGVLSMTMGELRDIISQKPGC